MSSQGNSVMVAQCVRPWVQLPALQKQQHKKRIKANSWMKDRREKKETGENMLLKSQSALVWKDLIELMYPPGGAHCDKQRK